MNVYLVYLRRPGSPRDERHDPFWEFGSFGRTGCHSRNLMHPRCSPLKSGDRLAFLQGGFQEIKLVGLTPPIVVKRGSGKIDVRWDDSYRPIPYDQAPKFVDNDGNSDFAGVIEFLKGANRTTYRGQAGSRLRTRTQPVEDDLCKQIVRRFSIADLPRISCYLEAVASSESAWVQGGLSSGWATFAYRSKEFGPKRCKPKVARAPALQKARGGICSYGRGRASCSWK
jgi:hypothetical protein